MQIKIFHLVGRYILIADQVIPPCRTIYSVPKASQYPKYTIIFDINITEDEPIGINHTNKTPICPPPLLWQSAIQKTLQTQDTIETPTEEDSAISLFQSASTPEQLLVQRKEQQPA
ncbi:MAG: hypothetical protein LBH04_05725 [Tannerellaceae bacterium]|nr:hypothetical protein [Tannerellaceae bacterium]